MVLRLSSLGETSLLPRAVNSAHLLNPLLFVNSGPPSPVAGSTRALCTRTNSGSRSPPIDLHDDCPCHTINSMMWGGTGINVGGISIPDSAGFQQSLLSTVKPGDYVPNVTNPNIVCKNGRPVLASSAIGTGLIQTTPQCLHAFLALGTSASNSNSA